MPIFNLKVKTNDGSGTYIDIDLQVFDEKKVTVTSTGLINLSQDALNQIGEGAVYDADSMILTLPLTIKGYAIEANATNVTYGIGDSVSVGVGSTTIYAVPDGGTSTPLNVDLTTLTGYESLAAGTYSIGVKAKAANYQDSDLSSTVSFTKLAAPVATASDTTVTWEAIDNAESYDVYVDGELYENVTGGVTLTPNPNIGLIISGDLTSQQQLIALSNWEFASSDNKAVENVWNSYSNMSFEELLQTLQIDISDSFTTQEGTAFNILDYEKLSSDRSMICIKEGDSYNVEANNVIEFEVISPDLTTVTYDNSTTCLFVIIDYVTAKPYFFELTKSSEWEVTLSVLGLAFIITLKQ